MNEKKKKKHAPTRSTLPPHIASYSAHAGEVLNKLTEAEKAVPEFALVTTKGRGKSASRQSGGGIVTDKFVEAIAVRASRNPDLAEATGIDPTALRDGIRFAAAYTPVGDAAIGMGTSIKDAVFFVRQQISEQARNGYAWLQFQQRVSRSKAIAKDLVVLKKLLRAASSTKKNGAKNPAKPSPSPSPPPSAGTAKQS